jgi:hypothetical protein
LRVYLDVISLSASVLIQAAAAFEPAGGGLLIFIKNERSVSVVMEPRQPGTNFLEEPALFLVAGVLFRDDLHIIIPVIRIHILTDISNLPMRQPPHL